MTFVIRVLMHVILVDRRDVPLPAEVRADHNARRADEEADVRRGHHQQVHLRHPTLEPLRLVDHAVATKSTWGFSSGRYVPPAAHPLAALCGSGLVYMHACVY